MQTEARFYLEKRKDKQTGKIISLNVPIFLFYSFGGQRLQYYTGLRVDAELWDDGLEKQTDGSEVRKHPGRVKSKHPDAGEINRELGRLKSRVEEIHDKAKALGEDLTLEDFRARLKGDKPLKKAKHDFVECFQEYINQSSLTKTKSTVKQITLAFKNLQEFSKDTRTALTFNNINMDFYHKLLDWCFNVKGYYNTSTGHVIKDLKAFMRWSCEEKSYHNNFEFKKKAFKKLREEIEVIYLTHEELMKLYNFDFSDKPEWAQVRDVFCFGCFTGMRFSDINSLAPAHIHKDFIQKRYIKSKANNNVPLNPYSKELLERYKGKLGDKVLPIIGLHDTNEFLRALLKHAKFNRMVELTHFRGATRFSETMPLHEAASFHISKKTFMTNFLAKGGSLLTAMSITGNKDLKTAKRYYTVVDSLKQAEMAKVWGSVPEPKKRRKAV